MAKDARLRQVSEPDPSALAHRALRAKLAATATRPELKKVIHDIEGFFPDARNDRESGAVNLAGWLAGYTNDPSGSYVAATPVVRKALDRRLWADATERLLELQSEESFSSALAMADQATALLPERPDLAAQLARKGLEKARKDLGAVRLDEARMMAQAYRERLRQPEEALNLLRDWLKVRQDRLSPTDAESPLVLAKLYEEWLEDKAAAIELLRKAWKIDPTSKEIDEAFRSRGYRRVKDGWVEAAPEPLSGPGSGASAPGAGASSGLRGLTAEEVRTKIGGKPDRVNYIGTKGQMIEQWIYYLDTKEVRFVNLLHAPGELKPRVVADYSLPLPKFKEGSAPAR
jgi:tetratricopeptide (TPR) repeat protein